MRKYVLLFLKLIVFGYRNLISPVLPNRCRFYPSCSHYALEALDTFGPWKGVWLICRRLLKCHPFHPGGIDLVSDQKVKE